VHIVRESYGREKPTLFPPEVRSGITEHILPTLPAGSFDLVYLDPPYGLTDGDWDKAPDWSWLGRETAQLLKPTGQVVFHGQGAMAARAVAAFEEFLAYRFEIVWVKASGPDSLLHTGMLQGTGTAPLHSHELIHVFRGKDAMVGDLTYNDVAMHRRGEPRGHYKRGARLANWNGLVGSYEGNDTGWRYPADVIFSTPNRSGQLYAAKPIDLVRYLILLLTRPGDLILEPYAGSGTTLLAAYLLGRRCLGIEASPKSWAILQRNLGGLLTPGRRRGK
jgi:DNA modification methylase